MKKAYYRESLQELQAIQVISKVAGVDRAGSSQFAGFPDRLSGRTFNKQSNSHQQQEFAHPEKPPVELLRNVSGCLSKQAFMAGDCPEFDYTTPFVYILQVIQDKAP
jgi:hypothetical protein